MRAGEHKQRKLREGHPARALGDADAARHVVGPRLSRTQAARLGARAAGALLRELGGWGRALRAARAEGLVPLLRCALRSGTIAPPARFARALRNPGPLEGIRAGVLAEEARASSKALAAAGVRHAVVKGAATAYLYGDRRLRPAVDVDVLVARRDLERAVAVLGSTGRRELSRNPIQAVLAPERGDVLSVSIDLHFALAYPYQFAPDVDAMLARAHERDGIRSLAAEDEILVAALHVARDCCILAGRAVADITVISLVASPERPDRCAEFRPAGPERPGLRRLRPTGPDWGAVADRAREWGLSGAAWAALVCARRTLGAPVPDGTIARLRPSMTREAYLRAWLDLGRLSPWRLARRGEVLATRRRAMLALWPAFVDGPARRVAFIARYAAGVR